MPGSTESVSSSVSHLVVGVNWIGDAIMSMSALQAWRRAHPGAPMTLLTRPGLAGLWSMHAAPTSVLIYEEPLPAMRTVARALRGTGVSRATVFPNSFRSAVIPFLARIPERVGRRGHWRRALLTHVLPDVDAAGRHQALEYYELLGLPVPAAGPEQPLLAIPESARQQAAALLRELPRPVLAVMPGAARGPAKQWPVQHFGEVAKRWSAERGGSVIAMGAKSDAGLGDEVVRAAGRGFNRAGQTTLIEWAALLAACDAVVCNDSGGMHLAAALGQPVVAVFGATDPRITGPLGPRARVVQADGPRSRAISRTDADAEKRLAAILPGQVYDALSAVLDHA
ncbi:MAG TPA: lipopolysaccharide heptosyltransferase II [Kiritimatiellia bacterium]|nr:lipopolysaccharide heptosyltransferase II [Kiritimatiellia bacterium]